MADGRGKNPNSLANLHLYTKNDPRNLNPSPAMIEGRKKGGRVAAQRRKEKKLMKQRLTELLEMGVGSGKIQDIKNLTDASVKNLSVQDAILVAQITQAINGSTKAAEFLRDTLGEAPVNKQDISANVTTSDKLDDILKALNDEDDEKDDTKDNEKDEENEK